MNFIFITNSFRGAFDFSTITIISGCPQSPGKLVKLKVLNIGPRDSKKTWNSLNIEKSIGIRYIFRIKCGFLRKQFGNSPPWFFSQKGPGKSFRTPIWLWYSRHLNYFFESLNIIWSKENILWLSLPQKDVRFKTNIGGKTKCFPGKTADKYFYKIQWATFLDPKLFWVRVYLHIYSRNIWTNRYLDFHIRLVKTNTKFHH